MPEAPAAPPPAAAPAAAPSNVNPPASKAAGEKQMPIVESAFDEIDRMSKEESKPRPAPKKEGKEAPPSKDASKPSSEGKPASSAESPSAKEKESSGQEESDSTKTASTDSSKPTEEKPPVKAAELRTAYENLKREHAKLKEEVSKAKSSPPPEDPEKAKLQEGVQAAQKRIADLEQELKFASYERTEEYQQKWQKPFESAFMAGRSKAAKLEVTQEDGTTRQGTEADFDAIMGEGNDRKAATMANEMFGAAAPSILFHRERVIELNAARGAAVEEYRKTGAEREKARQEQINQQQAQRQQAMAKLGETFTALNKEAAEKYPGFFKPAEGDDEVTKEGNRLLEKGMARADKAFSRDLPPEELVKVHAAVRNMAGAFDRLVYLRKHDQAKIAELQKIVDSYDGSSPGPDGGKKAAEKRPMTVEEEIDALSR